MNVLRITLCVCLLQQLCVASEHASRDDDVLSGFIGVPIVAEQHYADRLTLAEAGTAYTHETLPIGVWRALDGRQWPMPQAGRWEGLAWMCSRLSPKEGVVFDAQIGDYGLEVQSDTNQSVQIGDIISSAPIAASAAIITIFYEDRGVIGRLDPEDAVLTVQYPSAGGELRQTVSVELLGHIHGPHPIHCRQRDWSRAEELIARQHGSSGLVDQDGDLFAFLVSLPAARQACAIAGLVIITLVLLRRSRKYRKSQRG